jgi:hypothetical protein
MIGSVIFLLIAPPNDALLLAIADVFLGRASPLAFTGEL